MLPRAHTGMWEYLQEPYYCDDCDSWHLNLYDLDEDGTIYQGDHCQSVQELQVPGQRSHVHAPNNSRTSNPSTANRKAVARNSGARNTRSLADNVSIRARPAPAISSFTPSSTTDTARLSGA